MNKKILSIAIATLSFCSLSFAQSTTCPWVNAGPDQTICTPACATLNATFLASSATTTYSISTPAYAPDPYTAGTAVAVGDDQWSSVINIGFTFCYFGVPYTQCIIGSNGEISFKTGYATTYNTWPIGNAMPNVNPADLQGTVQGPWQDLYPPMGGTIKYQVYGTAPCRRFVASWNQISMYSCTSNYDYQQITLYETTNIIDNFIQFKPICSTWNGGYGIQCIQNWTGTTAFVVPGRNWPTQWSVTNDAKRYTPSGASTTTFNWLNSSNVSIGTNPTISVCPTTTSTYTAQVIYTNCDNTTVTVTDAVIVNVSTLAVTMSPNATICVGGSTVLSATATGATTWSWVPTTNLSCTTCSNPTANPTTTTTYSCYVGNGVCQGMGTVTVTVNPLPVISVTPSNPSYCIGGSSVLTASGATTYVWTPATNLSSTTTATVTANPTVTTTYTVTGTGPGGCTGTTTVTVTVHPNPTITVTPASATICASGSTNLTASGATTYVWSPATGLNCTTCATVTANPTTSTTYTVTGTNAFGCTGTTTVTVTVNPQPTITVTPSNPSFCAGGSTTMTASGANTYVWTPATNLSSTTTATVTANPTATTTYTVTGTAIGGCTATTTVTVTVNPNPTITVTPASAAICIGGSTNLTASGATSYVWTPATGLSCTTCPNPTANPTATTTYTVTGTNASGCTGTATVTITVNPLPVITVTPPNPSICPGGNINMTASGANTYVWTPATGLNCTTCATVNATPTVTTTYTITGTSAAGCIGTTTVTVTVTPGLIVTITPANPSICIGGNVTLTANNAVSYIWTPATGLNQTTGANVIASPTVTTTYSVTGTNASGCTGTASVTVTVNVPATLTISSVAALCNGGATGSATVIATGGNSPYTYVWTPSGQTTATATGLTAGTYTVVVTTANGCTSQTTVVVSQPTPVTATTVTVNSNCGTPSGSATANPTGGTGPYTYVWAPGGQTTQTATGLLSGSYTVTITDSHGCTVTATAIINNNAAGIATIPTHVNVTCFGLCNGTATSLMTGGQSPYTYLWTPTAQTTVTATGLCAGAYNVTITDANGCSSTATVTITQPTQVVVTLGPPTSVACNGGNNGSVTATGAGGTGVITYLWTPTGQTTATATGLGSGTYTVVVTDANGCTAQATITITQPTVLAATSTQVNVLCNGNTTGSATVTATGGTTPYSYFWNPNGQTTNVATGLGAGTYTCTTTDANGCTVNTIVTITQPTLLNLVLSNTTSTCGNPNGTATATVTGGTPIYTYLWSNGQTTSTATGLLANTYTVTITDANGCSITNNVTVPNAGSPSATINTSVNVSCFNGNNGSATVTVTGGTAPYTYVWNPTGQTTPTATGLPAATYTCTVTDANGCSTTATIVITQPTLLVAPITGSVNVLCFGGNNGSATVTASGGTAPYSYMWVPSVQTNATATGLTVGTYSCTTTDANGCTVQSTITITQPTALGIAVAGFNATCNGVCNGQVVCIPSGGVSPYIYSWAPTAGNTPSITGQCPGVYTCYITDANGCMINDTGIVQQPTAIALTSVSVTAHCNQNDGSATVTATGGTPGYTYLWNNGQTTANATALGPNTYTVVVTDFNGCTQSLVVVVPNAAGVVATNTNVTMVTCFGTCDGTATAVATGGVAPYTYSWSTIPPQITPTATGLCAGTYTCLITDASGCTDTTIVTITQPQQLVLTSIAPVTICIGQQTNLVTSASGGTPAYTYNWNPGNLNGPSIFVTPTITTTYTVTVTDINNCTAIQQTVTVTVNPQLNVVASGATAICIGGSATISANASGGNGGPYFYNWQPGGMGQASVSVTPTVTTTYTITVTDNCTTLPATDTVTIVVNPLPVISFTTQPSPASGCAPLCVDFTSTTPNSASCAWNFTIGNSNQCNTTFCFNNAGSYDVTLTVVDNNGCTNSQVFPSYVTVYPNPVADFSFGPQPTTVFNGLITFTDLSTGGSQWSWSFGDPLNSTSTTENTQFTYLDSGSYIVTQWVITQYGCKDSISKTVRIDPEFTFYMPNAFTPNGNGLNDTFGPKGEMLDPNNFKFWIFDRWGNTIFYSENIAHGWDGHANDGNDIAQEDVYVWKIETLDLAKNKKSYVGHVTLLK